MDCSQSLVAMTGSTACSATSSACPQVWPVEIGRDGESVRPIKLKLSVAGQGSGRPAAAHVQGTVRRRTGKRRAHRPCSECLLLGRTGHRMRTSRRSTCSTLQNLVGVDGQGRAYRKFHAGTKNHEMDRTRHRHSRNGKFCSNFYCSSRSSEAMRIADMNWMQVEAHVARDDRCGPAHRQSTEQHAYLSLCRRYDPGRKGLAAMRCRSRSAYRCSPCCNYGITSRASSTIPAPSRCKPLDLSAPSLDRPARQPARAPAFAASSIVNGHGGNGAGAIGADRRVARTRHRDTQVKLA